MLVTQLCLILVTPWTLARRLLCPWKSPGKNTGVSSHSLLQGIFPTQGWNLGLLHCRQILYCLSYQRSPCPRLFQFVFLFNYLFFYIYTYFFLFFIFYWSVVDLQCFRYTARWFSYTNTHILLLKLFSIIGYYKLLTIVPYAIQKTFVVCYVSIFKLEI